MNWKLYIKLCLTPFLLVSSIYFAFSIERVQFESLSTNKGLSHGTVNDIIQDDDGFIWICTDDGINRYDGYNFKQYTPLRDDEAEQNSIQCKCVIKDARGWLWFGTSTGLYYYDPKMDQIMYFMNKTSLEQDVQQLVNLIYTLFIDKDGQMWVGAHDGLISFDLNKAAESEIGLNDITTYAYDNNDPGHLSDYHIFTIYQDKAGIMWFSTYSTFLDSYNPETKAFNSLEIKHPNFEKDNFIYKKFIADKEDNFYIYSEGNGVVHWDRAKNEFSEFKFIDNKGAEISNSIVRSMLFDQNNCLWIGTDGKGIVIYEDGEFTRIKVDANNYSNLNSNAIYEIYEDEDENIWIGTYLSGINKLAKNKANFELFTKSPNSSEGLQGNLIFNFLEDHQGNIWIATDGDGLNKLNTKDYTFEHFYPDETKDNWISTATTIALWQDQNKDIWIGSYNGGLNKYSFKTNSFETFYHDANDPTSISSNHPWAFEEDKWGNLWIATVNAGLNLKKPGSDKFIRYVYKNEGDPEDALISNGLTDLYIDSRNFLWIATEAGLDVADLNAVDFSAEKPQLKFKHYVYSHTQNCISSNNVSFVTENHRGDMLVGTRVAGLSVLDMEADSFRVFKAEDGLPHNMIQGIIEDENHKVWISTANGIAVLDTAFRVITAFKAEDGLQDNAFIKTACYKARDGKMYFGGVKGFNAFYPDVLHKNSTPPRVKITDFRLFNKEIAVGEKVQERVLLPSAIQTLDQLELEYENNFISFQFTALDYTNPQNNQYAYFMEGFDNDWRYVSSDNRLATYTNLNPGTYTFRVKASNNDGIWNEQGTALEVVILPPWWETWWARTLFVILVIGVVLLLFFLRLRQLSNQKQILKETVTKRTRQLQKANSELKDLNDKKDKMVSIISHDVLSPFNAILGFSDYLATSHDMLEDGDLEKYSKLIYKSSKRLHELLVNLLLWSQSERGVLSYNPQDIAIENLVTETIALLKYAAGEKEIEISTSLPSEPLMAYTDPKMVGTIIRNLLSNAVKFTPHKGKIEITAEAVSSSVHVSVKDNGVGISPENQAKILSPNELLSTSGTNDEKGTGLGLKIVSEFIEKQGGELWINSAPEKGTTFTFSIPLKRDEEQV